MSRMGDILLQLETSFSALSTTLARRCGVSQRTIASDIAQLNLILAPAGSIQLNDGRYRLLVHDGEQFNLVRNRVVDEGRTFNHPERRTSYIISRLLVSDSPVTTESLAAEMSVSRTTVVADLVEARREARQHGVTIQGRPRVGLQLCGPELGIRLAALEYVRVEKDLPRDFSPELIDLVGEVAARHHIAGEDLRLLRRWVDVGLHRFRLGNGLSELPEEYVHLRGTQAHDFARELADRLAAVVGLVLPEPEILFLALPFASMRTPVSTAALSWLSVSSGSEEMVQRILARIDLEMDLNLVPSQLVDEFVHHIAYMLNRMRFGVSVPASKLTAELQREYPVAHRMATIAASVISSETMLVIDEDELALMAAYFQIFLEDHSLQRRSAVRVAIVASRGPASLRLIIAQLRRILPESTVFDLLPGRPSSLELESYDLVVTTPGASIMSNRPVVELSEVFDGAELARKLSAMPLHDGRSIAFSGHVGSLLLAMVDDDRFVSLPEDCDYGRGVELFVDYAEEKGLLPADFLPILREREQRSSMQLDEWFGFPHVIAPGVDSLVCLLAVFPKRPNDPGVRAIFFMVIPEREQYDDLLIRVYDDVIRVASDRNLLARISRLTSYEQFFYLVQNSVVERS